MSGLTRTTIVLAVLALILGGGYYLFDVRGREARERAQAAERRVMNFDPDDVREVIVEKPAERVVVRVEGDRWRILEPVRELADEATLEGLLSFVRGLEKIRSLEGPSELATVGLDKPEARLRLGLKSGEALTLLVGGPNPVRTGVYAAVEGAPVVFLAPARLGTELAKTPYLDELRDRAILPMDVEQIRRIEIARADTRIAIERLSDRQWQVERPFSGEGDDGIIRDLLWKIGSTRAQDIIRAAGRPAEYGLDRPHARLTIVHQNGESRALTVSQPTAEPRIVYAQVAGSRSVHVGPSQLLADLSISPDLLQKRQLLVYDPRQVERITIRYPTTRLVLERTAEGWRVRQPVDGEAVSTTVENILEVLPNLRYSTAHASAPGELNRYGLDPPRLAISVGLTGGRELPTLAVGREEGGVHFVMVGNTASVYTVDARLLRVVPEDPADAKRYSLPEQVKRSLKKSEDRQR
jgi:hypothetical protein